MLLALICNGNSLLLIEKKNCVVGQMSSLDGHTYITAHKEKINSFSARFCLCCLSQRELSPIGGGAITQAPRLTLVGGRGVS